MTGGLVIVALGTGCATAKSDKAMDPERQQISQAQAESKEAFERAQQAQQAAIDAENKSTQAEKDVTTARKQLEDAQARAQQARVEAQQAQKVAQETAQEAQRQALKSQKTALKAQQQQSVQERQQSKAFYQAQAKQATSQSINGRVVNVSGKSLVVKPDNEPPMTLTMGNDSNISLDGRKVTVQQLPEGSQVRANYELKQDGEPRVTNIEALSP